LARVLLQTEADPGPGTGKGARKREQVNNQNPFSRNSPRETKGATNLLPEEQRQRSWPEQARPTSRFIFYIG